jgi:hypothetical protein
MNIGKRIQKSIAEDRKNARKKAINVVSSSIHKSIEEQIKDKPVEEHQKIINEFLINKVAELTLDLRSATSRSLVRGN